MKIIARHFPVAADLQPLINGFWYWAAQGSESETSPVQCFVPDGMAELVFHLGRQRASVSYEGKQIKMPESLIVGVRKESLYWNMPGGGAVFGVSLKPEGLVALFDFSMADVSGSYAEAQAFFGDWLGALPAQIRDMQCPEAGTRMAGLFFRERLKSAIRKIEQPYLLHAVQHIRRSTGADSLRELSSKVYVGKRQLQRVFQDKIGFGPKIYGRIVRFRHTIEYVRRHPNATWTEISYEFGYADQSHFIRDFREFTGENPSVFLNNYTPQLNMPVAVAC